MTCVFDVEPYDGGWCVKICDTGEVLFFETGGQAEREARRLAALHPGPSRVRVQDRQRLAVGEWANATLDRLQAAVGSRPGQPFLSEMPDVRPA